MIYDLNDGCQSAGEYAVGEEHNAANLAEPPLRGLDLDVCHLGGGSGGSNGQLLHEGEFRSSSTAYLQVCLVIEKLSLEGERSNEVQCATGQLG